MDNKKVGKLIAKLRKEKELTQQQLGDKVGVGFRAVSKWERGLTMPDIGIINELSKILGISSDELLSGELKKNKSNKKKKMSLKLKITISIITSLIIIISSLMIYYNNKTYIYGIHSLNDNNYNIEGQVTFNKKHISIIVNKLHFTDQTLCSTMIKNYQYKIYANGEYIFGYGYKSSAMFLEENISIQEFTDNFRINYAGDTDINQINAQKSNIMIIFTFIDENDNEIVKEIKFSLYPTNKEENK